MLAKAGWPRSDTPVVRYAGALNDGIRKPASGDFLFLVVMSDADYDDQYFTTDNEPLITNSPRVSRGARPVAGGLNSGGLTRTRTRSHRT